MSHSGAVVFPDADAAVIIPHVAVLADATANADFPPGATHLFPLIHILARFLARPIPETLAILLVFLAFHGKKRVEILIALIIYITLTDLADIHSVQIIGTINIGKNSESEKHESRFQESHCVLGSFEEYVRKIRAPLDLSTFLISIWCTTDTNEFSFLVCRFSISTRRAINRD